ncbi:MAG: copper chaperone PCu(A)C [Candidatus Nanopelagicales bacterium]
MSVHHRRSAPKRRAAIVAGAALVAAVGLAGCSSGDASSGSSAAAGPITVTDAYINEPTLPERTGAFALVSNSSDAEVSLTGASVPSDAASEAQLHETTMVDGAMEMSQVASIPVPAGGTLQLKSGGYHMMLINPTLTVGQTVPITLTFSDGTSVTVDATVKAPEPVPTMSDDMSDDMSSEGMESEGMESEGMESDGMESEDMESASM